MPKYQRLRDFRATNIDAGIIKGFTALHYTCYHGKVEAAKVMLDIEYDIPTDEEVAIPAPGFSSSAKYKLVGASSILSIALLRK